MCPINPPHVVLVEASIRQLLPDGQQDGRLTAADWTGLRSRLLGRPNQAMAVKVGAAAATVKVGGTVPILAAGYNLVISPANFDTLVLKKVKVIYSLF